MSKDKKLPLLTLTLITLFMFISTLPMNLVEAQNQATIFVDPTNISDPHLASDNSFTVTVNVSNVINLFRWQIKLWFDSSLIECTVAYLPTDQIFTQEKIVPITLEIDNTEGFTMFGISLSKNSKTVNIEKGVLCALNFQILGRGSCSLTLDEADSFLLNADLEAIPTTLEDGVFNNRRNGHITQDQATVFVDPASIIDTTLTPSNNFTITINITDAPGLFSWQVNLFFDPTIMECTDAYYPEGHVFDELTYIPVEPVIDNITGSVLHGCSLLMGPVDVVQGVLCTLDFHILDTGSCDLMIDPLLSYILDYDTNDIPVTFEDGFFDNRIEEDVHDIAIMDVMPTSTSITVNDSVTIDVIVQNEGNFSETFNITAYYDGTAIETKVNVSLNAGESDVPEFTWNTTGVAIGTYTISANATIVSGEEDTEDNSFVDGTVEIIGALPPHDMAITDVTTSPTSVTINDSVTIDVTVENQGTEAETFNVTTYYDGTAIDTMTGISLSAGESDTLEFTWNTTGVAIGTYTISANATIVSGEEDTEDNSFVDGDVEVVEEIVPIHDIAVTDVTSSQTSVIVNDSILIDATVENQGTEAETFNVTAYYDGTAIDTMTGISLSAGESDTLEFTWNTTGVAIGTYTISANATIVPGEEEIEDNSYTNGDVEVVEEIVPIHDIAVTDVTSSQTSVIVNDSILIDVTVENQGIEAEMFDVTAYYDGIVIETMTDVSLAAGESDTLEFTWNTTGVAIGTYTISANATIIPGEEDIEDNSYTDGNVEVERASIIVNWADYPTEDYPCGDARYPFGGQYHNGEYPVWKNFTVTNRDKEGNIIYIAVQYPEATPSFEPSRSMIEVIFPYDPGWTQRVNLEDNLIEFFADGTGIPPGGCAIISVQFKHGPTAEDCRNGHVFHVTGTISKEKDAYTKIFQHTIEYIDKTPPNIKITFPNATNPSDNYAFIKRSDGNIWLLKPDCQDENVGLLWINGTVQDTCSGINRVEIWINNTYMGDATLSKSIGSRNKVSWWWSTDPTNNPQFWKDESWFNISARAYDNSVNDGKTLKHGDLTIPKTNSEETQKHWLFWIGIEGPVVTICENHEHIQWVPGNGRIDIWGETGFYPNTEVEIWLEEDPTNRLYGTRNQPFRILLETVTADNYGRFYTTIHHLPEIPRKPTCNGWRIRAVQPNKDLEGVDNFTIIPWITFENTMNQDDPTTWQTTKKGHVDDTINVYGHGFLPSKQSVWDPYCTIYVHIYYAGVAPLVYDQISQKRRVFNGTSELKWDNLEWSPRLSEILLAEVQTDENGYWSAEIKIPQSYGGLHAIYAVENRTVPDPGRNCRHSEVELVSSGWPNCVSASTSTNASELALKEAQSAIFDVWPTLEVSPSTAITNQYVTITGEGLPLPRYYKLWKNGEAIIESRDWCFVLDFGPYEQWAFENKRLRNNELDIAWVEEYWYPFSFYTPDPIEFFNSPVWKGKLTSITKDFTEECKESYQFHIGSKYLKVPVLPPDDYEVAVYYYDKNTQDFTHYHDASILVQVIKDPLSIHTEVGGLHLPGENVDVTVQVDVDGFITDATTLNLELYKGETFIDNLSYERINNGFYVASFECPTEAGDYSVKASATKEYESFTLYGTAMTAFTVNPTLAEINATIMTLEGHVATIDTSLGTLQTNLAEIDAKVIDIEGKVVTINTSIGTLQANIETINTKIADIQDRVVTIETDLGDLKKDAKDLNATIISVKDEILKIHTTVGNVNVSLSDINGIVHIQNDVAEIKTDLGDLKGEVLDLKDSYATIKTEIGRITAQADSIKSDVGLQPLTIGLSLIAALAAIAAAALILRKVYLK